MAEGHREAAAEKAAGGGRQPPAHPLPAAVASMGSQPGRGGTHCRAAHRAPRLTSSQAASPLASSAPFCSCCSAPEHRQSSAPASPAEPAAAWTFSAGSGGAVGLWGCDPPPAPALETLGLHGSTCAKHYSCIAESMARGKRGLQRGLQAPTSPLVLLLGGKRRCLNSYRKLLPRPSRALLRWGWLCFQSCFHLAVAACRFLPGSWLNLGTCNDVRLGHVSVPGR